jgi:DNA-binding NtrC family response regulator
MEAATLNPQAETLLIVDDDPLITDMFRHGMTKRGFRVLTATGGQEALALIRAEAGAINLVITDITMQDMDGFELARQLLEHAPGLPVLIATGHAPDPSQNPMPHNILGIVQKPYHARALADRIRTALDTTQPTGCPS